jgi:outer membrane protein
MKIYLLTLALLLQYSLYGQTEKYNFNLKQCVDYGLINHNSIVNAKIDEQIAKNKVGEIRGIGLPQINASGQFTDFLKVPLSPVPAEFFGGAPGTFALVQFAVKYNATGQVEASQIIFDGSYIVALQASKTYMELSQKSIKRTEIEIISNISKAYYAVLVNNERVNLLDANIAQLKSTLDQTIALNKAGFVEITDVSRLQVAYNNLITEKQKIERLVGLSNTLLKFQMGMNVEADLVIAEKLSDISLMEVALDETPVFDNRIEISLLETQQKLYSLDLKKNRYMYMPSLVAFGNLARQSPSNDFDFFDRNTNKWFNSAMWGLRLNIPIFDGGQKYYATQQSKLNLLKTENDIKNVKNAISMETQQAKINLENGLATLNIQKENLELAKEIARVTKVKYEKGMGSNLEVVTAETTLKEAQTNYYDAVYQVLNAKIDYDKAKGNLTK